MAEYQLIAPLPVVRLSATYRVRFEAIDPEDGSPVSGVVVSESVIFADDDGTGGADIPLGPFMYVPGPSTA